MKRIISKRNFFKLQQLKHFYLLPFNSFLFLLSFKCMWINSLKSLDVKFVWFRLFECSMQFIISLNSNEFHLSISPQKKNKKNGIRDIFIENVDFSTCIHRDSLHLLSNWNWWFFAFFFYWCWHHLPAMNEWMNITY